MSVTTRHYIFPTDEEPRRLAHRVLNGLIFGKDLLPQFAGTRQRVLSAVLENEDGKPSRLVSVEGSIWIFDADGGIQEGLHEALREVMNSIGGDATDSSTVVELHPRLSRKRLEKEFRWQPGKQELNQIIADIWPKKKADRLKSADGWSKRKPPLTFDARQAIDEISGLFWKISTAIEQLMESSQKSFGFEARERSRADPEYAHLYGAIADMSDWHLEVQRRRRTGKGVWYAVVNVTMWDGHVGRSVARFHDECEGKQAAVVAARKLLAQHADRFAENITVEAEVITDLEWKARLKDLAAD